MVQKTRIAFSVLLVLGCGSAPEPTALSLVERFEPGLVRDVVTPDAPAATFEWRFEGVASDPARLGWRAIRGDRRSRREGRPPVGQGDTSPGSGGRRP